MLAGVCGFQNYDLHVRVLRRRVENKCPEWPVTNSEPQIVSLQSVNTDMLRHFRQIRTQTTRGKENYETRSSAVTTIGKNPLSFVCVFLLKLFLYLLLNH